MRQFVTILIAFISAIFYSITSYSQTDTTKNSIYLWNNATTNAWDFAKDGLKIGQLGPDFYSFGGWNPANTPVSDNQVYKSNGTLGTWTKLSNAPWQGRHSFGLAIKNDTAFVFGGDLLSGSYQKDCWAGVRQNDGTISWTLLNNNVPWGSRILFAAFAHKGYIYVVGGQNTYSIADGSPNDIWRSRNGITWEQVQTGLTQFGKNLSGCGVSYNGNIYIIGGGIYDGVKTYSSTVWKSADDGISWQQLPDAPFVGRQYNENIVYGNKVFVCFGANTDLIPGDGNLNDLWYMDLNEKWYRVLSNTITPGRHAAGAGTYNGMLVIAGGQFNSRDVWVSNFSNKFEEIRMGAIATSPATESFLTLQNTSNGYGVLTQAPIATSIITSPNTIVRRNQNGDIQAGFIAATNNIIMPSTSGIRAMPGYKSDNPNDTYFYNFNAQSVRNFIGIGDTLKTNYFRSNAAGIDLGPVFNTYSTGVKGSTWLYNGDMNYLTDNGAGGPIGSSSPLSSINFWGKNSAGTFTKSAFINTQTETVAAGNISASMRLGVSGTTGSLLNALTIKENAKVVIDSALAVGRTAASLNTKLDAFYSANNDVGLSVGISSEVDVINNNQTAYQPVGINSTVRYRGSQSESGSGKGVRAVDLNMFVYNTGTTQYASGMRLDARNLGTGTVTNLSGAWIPSMENSGGGTITNSYGIKVDDQTGGTNNFGFYSNVSSGTNKYNFYSAGTAKSYFNGNVIIGSSNNDSDKLQVDGIILGTAIRTAAPKNSFTAGWKLGKYLNGLVNIDISDTSRQLLTRSGLSASAPISYNNTTGIISIDTSGTIATKDFVNKKFVALEDDQVVTGKKTFTDTISTDAVNVYSRGNNPASTNPARFITLKNDVGQTPNSSYGAMIAGSTKGGAIVLNNSADSSGEQALKLGTIDNNDVFTPALIVRNGSGVETKRSFIPSLNYADSLDVGAIANRFRTVYANSGDFSSGIKTGAPTNSIAAPWKLGKYLNGLVSIDIADTSRQLLTRSGLSAAGPIVYNDTTGIISIDTSATIATKDFGTKNYVTLANDQVVTGKKTFTDTISTDAVNVYSRGNNTASTNPARFITLKNDVGQTPNSSYGAMIAGSTKGGAIVLNNSADSSGEQALKLGTIDNNDVFTPALIVRNGSGVETKRSFIPSLNYADSLDVGAIVNRFRTVYANSADFSSGIKTGAPTNSIAAPWKLGKYLNGLVSIDIADTSRQLLTRSGLSAAGPIVYSDTTGIISIDTSATIATKDFGTKNYVTLANDQVVTGKKTFTDTISTDAVNVYSRGNNPASTNPARFITLKNDVGQTPNSSYGAMIAGSTKGGAIVLNNSADSSGEQALKLGTIDNNDVFMPALIVRNGGGVETKRSFIPSLNYADSLDVGAIANRFRTVYANSGDFSSGIKTGAPTNSIAAPWKLGKYLNGLVSIDIADTSRRLLTRSGLSAAGPIVYNDTTGIISIDTSATIATKAFGTKNYVTLANDQTITGNKTFAGVLKTNSFRSNAASVDLGATFNNYSTGIKGNTWLYNGDINYVQDNGSGGAVTSGLGSLSFWGKNSGGIFTKSAFISTKAETVTAGNVTASIRLGVAGSAGTLLNALTIKENAKVVVDSSIAIGRTTPSANTKVDAFYSATNDIGLSRGIASEIDVINNTQTSFQPIGISSTVRYRGSQSESGSGKGARALDANMFIYNTATTQHASGVRLDVRNLSNGTVTNLSGAWVPGIGNSGGGTVTNSYGIKVDDQSAGLHNFGFYSNISSGTNKYSFYSAGTAKSYFNGNVLIGTTADNGTDKVQVSGGMLATSIKAVKATIDTLKINGKAFINSVTFDETQKDTVLYQNPVTGEIRKTVPKISWEKISNKPVETTYGQNMQSSDGISTIYKIPHGFTNTPSWWMAVATSADAANILYITADAVNIIIHYLNPPAAGSNNLSWNFSVRPPSTNIPITDNYNTNNRNGVVASR